jgi:SAM-dependent methyltransferase
MSGGAATELYTSGDYAARNPGYHEEDSAWKAGQIAALLRRNGAATASVCEVGCGAGGVLAELQKRLPETTRLTGYEISPEGIRRCGPKANARLEYVLGDFTALATPAFDLLLCIDVLEHVEDCRGFARALRPRADLKLFHIPLELSLYKAAVPGRLLASTRRFGHIHFFNRETALDLLRGAGYTVLDSAFTPCGIACARTLEARLGRLPVQAVSWVSAGLAARLFGAHSLLVLAR